MKAMKAMKGPSTMKAKKALKKATKKAMVAESWVKSWSAIGEDHWVLVGLEWRDGKVKEYWERFVPKQRRKAKRQKKV